VVRKHPILFKFSERAVINKIDLNQINDVNIQKFVNVPKEINPYLQIFTTNAKIREGISELIIALEI